MGSHSPTMRLSSLPLFLCLLVSASATFRNKEKRVKEGGKKEEGGGCFEVYHTEEQLQYSDVCEQSFREVCGTEYSQECHDEPTTRLEEQCETSVVSEPVKVCTPGKAHKVCHTTNVESFREECSTSYTHHRCERGARRGRPSRESRSRARRASSVARDHLSFFRLLFSSLPCSSNRPQRHHRSLASLAASGFPTGTATSTLCRPLKRCATLNKTLPYATKSRKKRR